jgi:hypothetical protein
MRMMRLIALCAILLGTGLMFAVPSARAQASIGISVDFAPPPLPVYDQPPIPAAGYIWVPGYWAWSTDSGWYWVPGTWVLPPAVGLLWTPAYWAYNDGSYVFNEGYWAPQVGFYGGIDYGFGYTGYDYQGGYWSNGAFFYNTVVNNITSAAIRNTYQKAVPLRHRTTISYNGGPGGVRAKPTGAQLAAANERHTPATSEQRRHIQMAARDPALALSNNHGHPAVAATSHSGRFMGRGVMAARPGKPVPAAPPTAVRTGREGVAANGMRQRAAEQAGTARTRTERQPGVSANATPRRAAEQAGAVRRLAEPTPRGETRAARMPETGRGVAGVAPRGPRPHEQHFAAPTAPRAAPTAPRTARMAAPTRHLLMTAPNSALRPQPHVAAPHPAAAPHFAPAARPAPAPHVAAAPPHPAAGGGPRGGPPGRHR